MIEFERKGREVLVNVTATGAAFVFPFSFHTESDWAAILLLRDMRDRFNRLVKDVREQEYQAGWKAAKAKTTAKQTWFSWKLAR